jgi:hypothetical protein
MPHKHKLKKGNDLEAQYVIKGVHTNECLYLIYIQVQSPTNRERSVSSCSQAKQNDAWKTNCEKAST